MNSSTFLRYHDPQRHITIMFDNLCCLTDAVTVIDSPSSLSETQMDGLGRKRLHSVGSVTSLSSFSGHESPNEILSLPLASSRNCKVQRKRIAAEQTNILQGLFESGIHFPNREMRDRLSNELNLSPRTIQVWFQNRRQAARNKARGMERPQPGHKLAIRWMKPCVFPEAINDLQENIARKQEQNLVLLDMDRCNGVRVPTALSS